MCSAFMIACQQTAGKVSTCFLMFTDRGIGCAVRLFHLAREFMVLENVASILHRKSEMREIILFMVKACGGCE